MHTSEKNPNTKAPFAPTTMRLHPLEWLALAVILTLAAALRLGAPGVVEFKRDEANLSYMALDMARGREFPLLGIDSSVGIRNAPVNVWIMALPYLFSSDPLPATQFVGLMNVGAVLLAYLLTRRYYGPMAAVVAGLAFAVSPWAVVYSRKIWAQDMLPLFVVATVGTGLLGLVEGKRWAQWLHLPLLSLTGQIHYVTFVLIPITLYLVVVGRRRLTRAFYGSVALMALVTAPYVIGIVRDAQRHPETFNRILTRGVTANATPDVQAQGWRLTGAAAEYAWFTVNGANLHSITGPEQFERYLVSVPAAYPIFDAFGVVMALAAGWLAVRAARHRDGRTPIDLTLLLWLFGTPLAFSVTWTPTYPHYMIPILPAAYMMLGAGVAALWRGLHGRQQVRRVVFAIGGAGLVVVFGLQVWLKVALLQFVNVNHTPNGFGTPLGYFAPIREAVLAERSARVLINLDGQYIGYHDEATVWNFLLYDVPERRYLDPVTEVYPAEPTLALSHRCEGSPQPYSLRTTMEGCYAISTRSMTDYDATAYMPLADVDERFANGAQITAYRWEPERGCLTAVWQTTRGPLAEDYSMAVHFVNAAGDRILDADGLSLRGQFWRAGDTVTRTFCLAWGHERIGEIAGVRLGFYTATDTPDGKRFDNVPLLDAGGAAAGQMVAISLSPTR
jgi:hypothetical protein